MDRNTLTAIVLMVLLVFVYQWLTMPTGQQTKNDQTTIAKDSTQAAATTPAAAAPLSVAASLADTAAARSGLFRQPSNLQAQAFQIENDVLQLALSDKGGRIQKATLKNYQTHGGQPLVLLDGDNNVFNYKFAIGAQNAETQRYKFEGRQISPQAVAFRLYADSSAYIEQVYALKDGSYEVDYQFNMVGFDNKMAGNSPIELMWQNDLLQQEKSKQYEQNATGIYFKNKEESVNYTSETSDATADLTASIEWVAFKQQFFNQTLIADKTFDRGGKVSIAKPAETDTQPASPLLEKATANLVFDYKQTPTFAFPMKMYLGPNHYTTLQKMGHDMQRMIPLGWGIFGWVNRFAIIPMFNFFSKYIGNYGIIILLLTLVIKLVLMPLTFRSYLSFAKMNVLKPEIEEIKQKFPNDAQRQQMETMSLYSRAGVSPLGGCVPQLLQLPILIAMYRFFPASIELRQQGFLWAKDLSSYDSILNLPFSLPLYGDHVSLFCLLSSASTFVYSKLNNQMTPTTSDEMAMQMKMMQYMMPIMLLFIFNNMSAALTYYFFLSNVISYAQQWYIKNHMIDEAALHQQIQANKQRPAKSSGFQQILEQKLREQAEKNK